MELISSTVEFAVLRMSSNASLRYISEFAEQHLLLFGVIQWFSLEEFKKSKAPSRFAALSGSDLHSSRPQRYLSDQLASFSALTLLVGSSGF